MKNRRSGLWYFHFAIVWIGAIVFAYVIYPAFDFSKPVEEFGREAWIKIARMPFEEWVLWCAGIGQFFWSLGYIVFGEPEE